MIAAERWTPILLAACDALDFFYFPGRYLRRGGLPEFPRENLQRSLQDLCYRGLIEKRRDASGWVFRLTQKGKQRLGGDRDPEKQWNRSWDGLWRQVIFDIPVRQRSVRARLLYWFRANHFGYLQDSVWISPDPLELTRPWFRSLHASAEMAAFFESRVVAVSRNADVVTAAWDFRAVAKAYADYRHFLKTAFRKIPRETSPGVLWPILFEERKRWNAAMAADPLLPRSLWPKGYSGAASFTERREFLAKARQRAARFSPANFPPSP